MVTFYSNGPNTRDYTENFFHRHATGLVSAELACPFFTTVEPLRILALNDCQQIRLLIRLCEVTAPEALQEARAMPSVQIRYYTSQTFHAKFYLLGSRALIGSANLTGGGLRRNRELSVEIGSEDQSFEELPALFDELWNAARVLTDDALAHFEQWRRSHHPQDASPIEGVPAAAPPTINVATRTADRVRTYLETLRRRYVEQILPAYRIVREIYKSRGDRRVDLSEYPFDYEIDRFLYWLKEGTSDADLLQLPTREGDNLVRFTNEQISEWLQSRSAAGYFDDVERLNRLSNLRSIFSSKNDLAQVNIDSLTDALLTCAAFYDRLRFAAGGLENHVRIFKRENDLEHMRRSFAHLAFGQGDYVQRIYDCIYDPDFKIRGFGESCTWELFGWINHEDVPPVNGRVIKALRYLGFDLQI